MRLSLTAKVSNVSRQNTFHCQHWLSCIMGSIASPIGLDHCYYKSSKFALDGMSAIMPRCPEERGYPGSYCEAWWEHCHCNECAVGEVSTRGSGN